MIQHLRFRVRPALRARFSARARAVTTAALTALLLAPLTALVAASPAGAQERPMTWLDMQEMASPGSWTPSPDGDWLLYTIRTPTGRRTGIRRTSTWCR
jgi:hypothetical protein